MLVSCGMSHSQALAAATLGSASILGLDSEIGSIEQGKRADLLLVEGDPTQDLSSLQRVREVIIDGHIATWDMIANTSH